MPPTALRGEALSAARRAHELRPDEVAGSALGLFGWTGGARPAGIAAVALEAFSPCLGAWTSCNLAPEAR